MTIARNFDGATANHLKAVLLVKRLHRRAKRRLDQAQEREKRRERRAARRFRPSTRRARRVRKPINDLHREYGETYFKRAFRMTHPVFEKLFKMLEPSLVAVMNKTGPQAVNGSIPLESRLGAALRYFAGGAAYDIAVIFGISPSSVYESVNFVIEAINRTPEFNIDFPADHEEQGRIALEFKKNSVAGIDCCTGCADGLLIWMSKPTLKDCKTCGIGCTKFHCSRKGKYGLNMQAVCDANNRFLAVSIQYGGSSSDLLAFEASELRLQLEEEGFLAPGLCIFGDNAYVNTHYMATPYPNVQGDMERDSYNFYHSQLRIKIECTFGILIHRWGILSKRMSRRFTVGKTVALVTALCKLHNFLIDSEEGHSASSLAIDRLNMEDEGAIPAGRLMHVGHHTDDWSEREPRVSERYGDETLPREAICEHVLEQGLSRPAN